MIIKVAIEKDNDKVVWRDPYSAAIRNRLRVDLNLFDIENKEEALTNLGVRDYVNKRVGNIPWNDSTNKTSVKEYVDAIDKKLSDKETENVNNLQEQIDELKRALKQLSDDIYAALSDLQSDLRKYIDDNIKKIRNEMSTSVGSITAALETLPVGTIIPFKGDINSIPSNWKVCDGTDGTPDLSNRFLQGGTSNIGSFVEAGLPNITGQFGGNARPGAPTGAFWQIRNGDQGNHTSSDGNYVGFNASRSSAIYGKSKTVQPPSYIVYYIMKVREKN